MVLYDTAEEEVRASPTRPADLRRIGSEEFEEKWSGYAVLFAYTPEFENAPETKPSRLQPGDSSTWRRCLYTPA